MAQNTIPFLFYLTIRTNWSRKLAFPPRIMLYAKRLSWFKSLLLFMKKFLLLTRRMNLTVCFTAQIKVTSGASGPLVPKCNKNQADLICALSTSLLPHANIPHFLSTLRI